MGNTSSIVFEEEPVDIWWNNMDQQSTREIDNIDNVSTTTVRQMSEENVEKLNEFKLELARKHEKRRELIAEKKREMQQLREELLKLRKENEELKENNSSRSDEDLETLRQENISLKLQLEQERENKLNYGTLLEQNKKLKMNIAEMQLELQNLNSEIVDFEKERQDYKDHVVALKDVIAVSKQMLLIRDAQLKELKKKIDGIEQSLSGNDLNLLSQDLRNEYERQLQNIRNLRTLYEERQRLDKCEKDKLLAELEQIKKELANAQNIHKELEEYVNSLKIENSNKYDKIKSLESNLGLANAESRQYQSELTVINQLFSELLLGFNNTQDINLDKLMQLLEEHHDLLQNIVINEESSQVSSILPKLLLDLVNQVNNNNDNANNVENENHEQINIKERTGVLSHQMNSAEEIVENLPKVWRVLIELLSHQKAPFNDLTDNITNEQNPCYKTIQTSKGPSSVLSVSQTFIRLKNLILEKKSLEKETNHLKQLNTHLENRLQDQEKRLEMVTSELSKTWHVVGKLQKQHQLLHTQEKILRYELAQKRKLLTELKQELEYSREKWQQAREKNVTTEKQWSQLRTEFAARRIVVDDGVNNNSSVESGYSDERESSSTDEEDEPGYETDVFECNEKTLVSEETASKNQSQIDKCEMFNLKQENINKTSLEQSDSSGLILLNTLSYKTDLKQNSEKTVNSTLDNSASTSSINTQSSETSSIKASDEILAAREQRLKHLEGQCKQLVTKVKNTANKSDAISNKINHLHEIYGESSKIRDSANNEYSEDDEE